MSCCANEALEQYVPAFLKIAAIGTVADVMDLTGENRAIVALGLLDLPKTVNLGLKALMEVADCRREMTSYHIGFRIGAADQCRRPNGRRRSMSSSFLKPSDYEKPVSSPVCSTAAIANVSRCSKRSPNWPCSRRKTSTTAFRRRRGRGLASRRDRPCGIAYRREALSADDRSFDRERLRTRQRAQLWPVFTC